MMKQILCAFIFSMSCCSGILASLNTITQEREEQKKLFYEQLNQQKVGALINSMVDMEVSDIEDGLNQWIVEARTVDRNNTSFLNELRSALIEYQTKKAFIIAPQIIIWSIVSMVSTYAFYRCYKCYQGASKEYKRIEEELWSQGGFIVSQKGPKFLTIIGKNITAKELMHTVFGKGAEIFKAHLHLTDSLNEVMAQGVMGIFSYFFAGAFCLIGVRAHTKFCGIIKKLDSILMFVRVCEGGSRIPLHVVLQAADKYNNQTL